MIKKEIPPHPTLPKRVSYLCPVARILAIDYGTKRTGLAVTDPLQIIASGLTTVPTPELWDYLLRYMNEEEVECVVLGEPFHLDGNPTALVPVIKELGAKLIKQYPAIRVDYHDERFTSEMAKEAIRQSGARRKKRRDKSLIDKMAATIILQEYLEAYKYSNKWFYLYMPTGNLYLEK